VIHALEAHHAPVVSLWVWYHVGGRNEVPGTTGMSHFLEHMLFKGTPAHPKGDLDRLLARYGAQWNAFTNEDVTCYYETIPKARYATALELEADRMRNALISLEETEAERTVIVSEREGLENDPSFLLGEELQAVAFSRHPYGQGVIGSKDEIKLMSRDGLYAHYRRFYAPNNAYVVVAGDDDAAHLADMAAKVTSRTKVFAIGASSNALGTVNDLALARRLARAVGALPVFAFTVIPAAAALMITERMGKTIALSIFFGVIAASVGYYFSWVEQLPTGASMVIVASVFLVPGFVRILRRKTG